MWRPELAREIALHRAVPTEAVVLMLFGIDLDLCHDPFHPFRDRFALTSRHAAEHSGTLDAACPACRRVERVRQYLLELFTPVVLALPPEMTEYRVLRAALGRGKRVVDESVPGALTAGWRDSFERAEDERASALKRAWAVARTALEG